MPSLRRSLHSMLRKKENHKVTTMGGSSSNLVSCNFITPSTWIRHPSCRVSQGTKHAIEDVAPPLWSSTVAAAKPPTGTQRAEKHDAISKAFVTLVIKSAGKDMWGKPRLRQNLTPASQHSKVGSRIKGQARPHPKTLAK